MHTLPTRPTRIPPFRNRITGFDIIILDILVVNGVHMMHINLHHTIYSFTFMLTGGAPPPLKLEKIWFLWCKIVIFWHEISQKFSSLLPLAAIFLSARLPPPPPNLKSWIRPCWPHFSIPFRDKYDFCKMVKLLWINL